jgi:hypothetical protein
MMGFQAAALIEEVQTNIDESLLLLLLQRIGESFAQKSEEFSAGLSQIEWPSKEEITVSLSNLNY